MGQAAHEFAEVLEDVARKKRTRVRKRGTAGKSAVAGPRINVLRWSEPVLGMT